MKIRTDFVTNSSSYCTTEVIIDNLVLLEILQKYKDMGLYGNNDPIFGIGTYESVDGQFSKAQYQDQTTTPAFFYFEAQNDEGIEALFLVNWIIPGSLDKVLEDIISIIDSGDKYLDTELIAQLKEELLKRKDEIYQAYSNVYWRSSGWADGELNLLFTFDPVNGSSYIERDDETSHETEIAVYNPLLLEILQKYKDIGLFGDRDPIVGIGDFHSIDLRCGGSDEFSTFPGDPAFYYYEQERILDDEYLVLARFCPKRLSDILEGLITIMENGVDHLDAKILSQLKEELRHRKDEINQTFSKFYWSYQNGLEREKFEYDPNVGENFSTLYWSGEWVEDEKEGDE